MRRMQEAWAGEIGERIRQARESKELSRPDAADLLTLHERTLANYERGEHIPFRSLSEIAGRLGVDLRWLLHGDEFLDPLLDIRAKVEELLAHQLERELEDAADETDQQQERDSGEENAESGASG